MTYPFLPTFYTPPQNNPYSSAPPFTSLGDDTPAMVSSTSLTALLVITLSSISSTYAQDQSTPTSTSAGSAPESSSTGSASVGSNTTTNTYTPVISNHTNPLWNPNSNSTDPYAVGNNNSYSPPFPYTLTRGSGPTWDTAIQKAKDFIQFHNLTIEEKVNLTTGLGWEGKGYSGRACVGNIPPIERIGWKGLCLEDSPAGVRFTDGVSVFPAGINVASTFDRGLMYSRGYAMGKEFVGKGVNVALGPGESACALGPHATRRSFLYTPNLLSLTCSATLIRDEWRTDPQRRKELGNGRRGSLLGR